MAAACGGQRLPTPGSGSPATPSAGGGSTLTPSGRTPTPTPTPSIDSDVQLPRDAPTAVRGLPADPGSASALAPSGAEVTGSYVTEAEGSTALAFAWTRGKDPLSAESGFEVWGSVEGDPESWRVEYAFTDRPSSGVLGVRFETGDLTADGVPDVLTLEDLGGSGACAAWRVVRVVPPQAGEILARRGCDTQVRIAAGDLEVRRAVFRPGDSHCCPSAYRVTTLAWNGEGWDVTGRRTEPA
jgi:hypothetical protein